jgi:hypothetical protein
MRRNWQSTVVIGLALFLCAQASAADKAAKQGVVGVVTSVDKDSITVKIVTRTKGSGSDTPAEEKTFKVSKDTTVQTVTRVKGQKTPDTTDSTFDDVKVGERVRIIGDDGTAQKISILGQGKKKTSSNTLGGKF